MIIRFFKENRYGGCVLVEVPPQTRILSVHDLRYGGDKFIKVNLPYLYFFVRYDIKNGKYLYRGIASSGLHIFSSTKKILTTDQILQVLPTDVNGICCTNHDFDEKLFNSVKDLVKLVISLWYGHQHLIVYNVEKNSSTSSYCYLGDSVHNENIKAFTDTKFQDMKLRNWNRGSSYNDILNYLLIEQDIDFEFIDEEWADEN